MRVSKVVPAVAIGQPVPIVDETTGVTFLVAGGQGSAEWTLEAMKPGTLTLDIDVRATYQKPGQPDFKLGGHAATTIVVSDPRFHVNFSHPDVVRKDDKYTAYAFVTNLSAQRQHVFLDHSDIPPCSSGSVANNVCRSEGADRVELDVGPERERNRIRGPREQQAKLRQMSDDHASVLRIRARQMSASANRPRYFSRALNDAAGVYLNLKVPWMGSDPIHRTRA
jgi:hypothetical protein